MKYHVSFILEVEGEEAEELVDEAVTAVVDEELSAQRSGGTRCGVKFLDATFFQVSKEGT